MPTLSSADAGRPLLTALGALHESLTGSLRLFEEEAADDARFGPLLAEIRDELNRVDALRTQIKN